MWKQWVLLLENIKPEWTVESRTTQAVLRYFRHVTRQKRGMAIDAMFGEISGKRGEKDEQYG